MHLQNTFRWWKSGDLDGFFGLFVDNLLQLILIVVLCDKILGMSGELIYGRILPGAAVSLLVGNIFYAFQSRTLYLKTGKTDVTALPYGINTVSLFAYILFVMKPVVEQTHDVELAWRAGLAACLGSGIIEFGGAFIAERIKNITPRAALLTTLAGIAITFISMDFCLRIFSDPMVAFVPLAFIFIQYIGRIYLPAKIPAGFVAVISGTILAWLFGRMDGNLLSSKFDMQFHIPMPYIGDLLSSIFSPYMFAFLPVIIPMGLFNLFGSLQNLESAEAAGDKYPVKSSLAVNGIGTMAAASFGSVFPTTIYIGHPGWKAMGAGAGYSVANGLAITILCLFGLLGFVSAFIPVEAGAAILLWIGITITAQAFQSTPREHAPAVVVGFFPALAAWGVLMLESGLRAAGTNIGAVGLNSLAKQIPIHGLISLERGFIFTSMILAAMTVALIERHYRAAAGWAAAAALVSAVGLMHGYKIVDGAIVNAYGLSHTWQFVLGYIGIAALFLILGLKRGKEK